MRTFKYIISICMAAAIFTSCEQKDVVVDGEPLALTVTPSKVVLNQDIPLKEAVKFSWTSGTNGKTGNAIYYYFEFDRAGNDFKAGYKKEVGKTSDRNILFTHGGFNSLLKELWPDLTEHYGELMQYEARVTATVAGNAAPKQVSPVVKFEASIYKNEYKQMFMIGPATLAKDPWNTATAQVMYQIEGEDGGFIYEGMLNSGEMKFLTSRESFDEAFVKESPDDDTKMAFLYTVGGVPSVPDYKWNIAQSGEYRVKMNYKNLTCSIELLRAQDDLYIKGSATTATTKMSLDYGYGKYKYNGVLKPGYYYFTSSAKLPIDKSYGKGASETQIKAYDGDCGEEAGWYISSTAVFTLLVDLNTNTLFISQTAIEDVWICGDATPSGWWITEDKTVKLKKESDGVFTYTGKLTNGTLKFPLQLGDWFGLFIFAPVANTPAKGETGMDIGSGHSGDDGDKKWVVSTPGDYIVTVDLNALKVRFEEQ